MKRISDFATRLKEYRDAHDITLLELEKITGVPAQTLNRYELKQRVPKIDVANTIAEKLGVDALWLQGYDTQEAPIDTHAIAQRVYERRIQCGLSIQDVSLLTGISQSDLQDYENGEIQNIPLDKINGLAFALKTSPEWILGFPNASAPGKTSSPNSNKNVVRMIGRNGSYKEIEFNDEEFKLLKKMISNLPDADDL